MEAKAPIGRFFEAASRFSFVRHLVGMFVAMCVGMMVGPFLFALALGTSVDDALRGHAVAFVVVMAVSMTVPMVAWMLYTGHSSRSAGEMAAVMAAPAIPLICLKIASVITGPVCGLYCVGSTLAMVALVVYRRDEYRHAVHVHT